MYRMIIAVTVHNSKNVYATQTPADKYDGLKKTVYLHSKILHSSKIHCYKQHCA